MLINNLWRYKYTYMAVKGKRKIFEENTLDLDSCFTCYNGGRAADEEGRAEHQPRKAGWLLRDFAAVACSVARRCGAQTRRAAGGAVSNREGVRPPMRGALMRREAAGKPPKGGGCNYLLAPEGCRQAPNGAVFNFLYPPQGYSREAGATAATRHNNCVVGVVVVLLWRGGKRAMPKAAPQVRRRAAKAAACRKPLRLCRRRARRAGIRVSKSTRRTEPLQRRAAKAAACRRRGEVTPQAARAKP